MSFIRVKNITAGYQKRNVIENISFDIEQEELVGILGANGSGKSTLVKSICSIMPHEGDVVIEDHKISAKSPKEIANLIGYVPQKSGISIDMTVLEVVLMGFNPKLKMLENPGKEMVQKASEAIACVGLSEKINTNYMHLSEGQKQLALLARSLIGDGKLLVMDEPENALDFGVRYKLLQQIREWIRSGSRAGIVTLHDINLALNNCDRLILMKEKKIAGILSPKNDIISVMEEKLSEIYGDIKIVKTTNRFGRDNLVMIYNSEE